MYIAIYCVRRSLYICISHKKKQCIYSAGMNVLVTIRVYILCIYLLFSYNYLYTIACIRSYFMLLLICYIYKTIINVFLCTVDMNILFAVKVVCGHDMCNLWCILWLWRLSLRFYNNYFFDFGQSVKAYQFYDFYRFNRI